MTRNDKSSMSITTASGRFKRWQVILTIILVILVLIASILYIQKSIIYDWLTHSHIPSEDARAAGGKTVLPSLKLPQGFQSKIFFTGLSDPRMITFSSAGILF